jgi:hypothetical protein
VKEKKQHKRDSWCARAQKSAEVIDKKEWEICALGEE